MEEILREFYDLRLKMYEKRKAYMVISKIQKDLCMYIEKMAYMVFSKGFSCTPAWCCQKGLDLIQYSQVGSLAGEAKKLSNQARFILEKCDGSLKVDPSKTSFFSTKRNASLGRK